MQGYFIGVNIPPKHIKRFFTFYGSEMGSDLIEPLIAQLFSEKKLAQPSPMDSCAFYFPQHHCFISRKVRRYRKYAKNLLPSIQPSFFIQIFIKKLQLTVCGLAFGRDCYYKPEYEADTSKLVETFIRRMKLRLIPNRLLSGRLLVFFSHYFNCSF